MSMKPVLSLQDTTGFNKKLLYKLDTYYQTTRCLTVKKILIWKFHILFDTDNEIGRLLRNVNAFLSDYMVAHSNREIRVRSTWQLLPPSCVSNSWTPVGLYRDSSSTINRLNGFLCYNFRRKGSWTCSAFVTSFGKKGKDKVHPRTSSRQEVEVQLYSLLKASAQMNATPSPFYLWERRGTYYIGSWVKPRAGLDGCINRDTIPGPYNP